jgi:uncharacterized protein (DUF58 family)
VILPSRLLLALSALWLALAAGGALGWWPTTLWGYSGALLAAVTAIDAYGLLRAPVPSARRETSAAFAAGRWHDVQLLLTNDAQRAIQTRVFDLHPAAFTSRDLPLEVNIPARGWARVTYGLRSVRRGVFNFAGVELRLRSPLGLLERHARIGEAQSVHVYPDFGALAGYALLATDHHLSQLGVLQRRRRGEGMDFHQLREYRIGDSLRRIDWKATSRMHRLISREYQDERDQEIVLLLDCSRRMAARDGELSHFDATLNAALLLAHVGLHHGDAVGVLTMGGESRFIAPRKSRATISLMLHQLYDLEPSLRPPDYYFAALELMRRVRKRALVIVLSNLRDEDDDTLLPALGLLRRRHLVLFASLRERVLTAALAEPVKDFDGALAHAAAADYLKDRFASFRRLERAGAHLLDVEPQELALALVNRYLEIKRTGIL